MEGGGEGDGQTQGKGERQIGKEIRQKGRAMAQRARQSEWECVCVFVKVFFVTLIVHFSAPSQFDRAMFTVKREATPRLGGEG